MIKVDIILLTRNNISNTFKCIQNIYSYTSDFRLIVFDNASIDNTSVFLLDFANKKDNMDVYISDHNRGIVGGRCDAYDFLRENYYVSPYVCFIDNDQYVQRGWFETYLRLLGQYDVVGTEAWKMRSDFYPYKRISSRNDDFSYVGAGGIIIKREVIDSIGLFDMMFNPFYFEDPDFVFTAYKNGFKIGWNYEGKIIHKHEGPLLTPERKIHFMNNWKKFKNKWDGFKLPAFKMG